ncbi:GntR family transcriptional regulator [Paenibacillus sp. JDR-2]|uniref:GntR family transcriptional regulator n=1 Tax=Paenibacillus sp. (strain JDR-2) TaxID=324057 RepID=UPI000166B0C2|nr:GntR family transcriptional regulator [Paenibacillus sp. JDR-2]ACS99202.1 transcriptional regulator, GntR family with LacI sensor [Paenibacillus sp. JDR-2]
MAKYTVIKEDIKRRLNSGEWTEGYRLPSSREFAQYYESSVNTIEKAIKELAEEGWLIRDTRRGTFMDKGKEPLPGGSRLVAAFVFGIDNPIWATALRGVEDVLFLRGYQLLSSSDDRNMAKLESLVRGAVERKVEGVILSPIMNQGHEEINNRIFSMLESNGIKHVNLDRAVHNTSIPYVTSDNLTGAYNLTKLLIAQGHRRILFIKNSNISTINERLCGFKQAFIDSDLEYSDEFEVFISTKNEDFIDEFDAYCEVLEKKMKEMQFTAVFTANDQIAEAAIRSFENLNYRIPEDVSLVTYDAENLNRRSKLNVTGVTQPFYEMGQCAAKLLLNMIDDHENQSFYGQVCNSKMYIGKSVKSIVT